MNTPLPSLRNTYRDLQEQRAELADQLDRIDSCLRLLTGTGSRLVKRRHLSPAARKRISEAQKTRWAKWKRKASTR